ncbi:MAG: hypothetical protein ACOC6Q_02750, partial [Patescibacteria group bacterium]
TPTPTPTPAPPEPISGKEKVKLTLQVPAESIKNILGQDLQKTRTIRVQVRDVAGNVAVKDLDLYQGWFQAVNGGVYANCHTGNWSSCFAPSINVNLPEQSQLLGSFEKDHPNFIAATPPNSGGFPIGRSHLGVRDPDRASERENWAITSYAFEPLNLSEEMKEVDWKDSLDFSWDDLAADAGENQWNGNDTLSAGEFYTYSSTEELEGSYDINSRGVAVVYVPGNLRIGDNTDNGANKFVSQDMENKGLVLVVEGDVFIGADITKLDAFVIANGEVIFEMGKGEDVLTINGGLVGRDGIDVLRFFFRIYRPIFRVWANPLYAHPGHHLPHLRTEKMLWHER